MDFGFEDEAALNQVAAGEVPTLQQPEAPPLKRRRTNARQSKGSAGGNGGKIIKSCFAADCSEECIKGKKWCSNHNRIFDAMSYHAKKDGESKVFMQVMSDAIECAKAFKRFSDENPIQGKWQRKRFVEWSQFRKEHSLAIVHNDVQGTKPFEKGQWVQRGIHKMGWSKQQCLSEWERHCKDNSVQRDSLGLDGALRLWIHVVEKKTQDKERTDGLKNPLACVFSLMTN